MAHTYVTFLSLDCSTNPLNFLCSFLCGSPTVVASGSLEESRVKPRNFFLPLFFAKRFSHSTRFDYSQGVIRLILINSFTCNWPFDYCTLFCRQSIRMKFVARAC